MLKKYHTIIINLISIPSVLMKNCIEIRLTLINILQAQLKLEFMKTKENSLKLHRIIQLHTFDFIALIFIQIIYHIYNIYICQSFISTLNEFSEAYVK